MRERYQNPITNDSIRLRFFTYNSNNAKNVYSVDKITIFYLDPSNRSESNPDGRVEVVVIDPSSVQVSEEGSYYIEIDTPSPQYLIGNYLDVWSVVFEENEALTDIEQGFTIYPDLWMTTPTPIIYDFNFKFRPTMIPKGSKKHLIIEIMPNVPKANDLQRYYFNLAVVANLKVSIEMACGPCMPVEDDLRLIVEDALIDFREKCFGYYFLDTTEYECGVYNIWFKLEFANNVFVSEKQQFQIFN